MKLTIRPLQRGAALFVVEAEPSETIGDLKLQISAKQGYPVESQNILSSGKSLQDDKSIASYNIKDASILILVLKGGPAGPASTSAVNSPGTAPQAALPFGAPRPPVPAPAPTRPSIPTGLGSGPAFSGPGLSSNLGVSQANIDQIMGMGLDFTREQVVNALRASFDNPDQAVDLLLGGGPTLPRNGPVPNGAQSSNLLANLPGLMSGGAPGAVPGFPQNMLQPMLEQQPQGQQQPVDRRDSSAMSMGGMGALGGLGSMGGMGGMGGMGSSGGSGDGDGSAIEIDPAQVRAIRRMVAENPSLTGPLIESLKQTDPERAAHLTPSDPDGILSFFEKLGNDEAPPSGGNGAIARLPAPSEPRRAVSPPAAQNLGLTPAEQASVESLEAMGYPRDAVLQAFLSCGKNRELAADFLIEGAFNQD